jgi:hypothetical protein
VSKSFTIRIPNDVWDKLSAEAAGRLVTVSFIVMERLRGGPEPALVEATPSPRTLPPGMVDGAVHDAHGNYRSLHDRAEKRLVVDKPTSGMASLDKRPTDFPSRPVRQREHV